MGLYKKLNVCISNNLDFVAIHCSIHVLHLGGASFLQLFSAVDNFSWVFRVYHVFLMVSGAYLAL